jgi:predicted dehydrogenase/nucleoside-diphosphate-sugar epimerase
MTQVGTPRLALIGCGSVVAHHLLPALLRIGWRPSVLVDRSRTNCEKLVAQMGRRAPVTIAADWTEVEGQFDAAIVATPSATHGAIGNALAGRGIHVFMEKPLAHTVIQAERMVATAEEKGSVLAVGLLRRHLAIARWTRALLASGLLGRIERFEAREGFVYNWAVSSADMLRPGTAGGGVLMDTGAHTLDLLLWWLGDAQKVTYQDDTQAGVEADCRLDLVMESGAIGSVELSRSRNLRNSVRIVGTKGHVEVHLYANEVLSASPEVLDFTHEGISPRNMPPQIFADLFEAELRDFLRAAAQRSAPSVDGSESLRSIALIEKCYANRRPLALPWAAAQAGPDLSGLRGRIAVVTGAAGFIGGRLAERLSLDYGVTVRCIVRNLAQAARLARLPVEIIHADLLDQKAMDAALQGADYVFHCAYDTRSRKQNTDGLDILIEGCLTHQTRRFVHLSTFSVYEPLPNGLLNEGTRDGDRAWIYVRNKLDLERVVLDAARDRGLPGVVLQPSIVYGAFCKPWTDAVAEMLLGGKVVLPEDSGLCNAVYVDDLVDAMLLAATVERAIGERFVITGPDAPAWSQVFGRFQQALGVDSLVFWDAEAIRRAGKGFGKDLSMLLEDPKKIIQVIVRWKLARQALQAGFDNMPSAMRQLVLRHYFMKKKPSRNLVALPDMQKLALYRAKADVRNDKAEALIGYRPRYRFDDGMAVTAEYLAWAYGDVPRSSARGRPADRHGAVPGAPESMLEPPVGAGAEVLRP